MSNYTYTSIPNQIIQYKLKPTEQAVYFAICHFMNHKTNQAWPSYQTIAEIANVTRRTAINIVKRLCDKGIIKKTIRKVQSKFGNITNTSNAYSPENIHYPSENKDTTLVNLNTPELKDLNHTNEPIYKQSKQSGKKPNYIKSVRDKFKPNKKAADSKYNQFHEWLNSDPINYREQNKNTLQQAFKRFESGANQGNHGSHVLE